MSDKRQHDVVMIGAGPAALTAAIYTTREDIDTLLFERGVVGGLAAVTDIIDNYPGFSQGVHGIELGEVLAIHDEGKLKRLETTSGDIYTKVVLIATGCDYKKTGVPGESGYY